MDIHVSFTYGLLGGFFAEVFRLYSLARLSPPPKWLKSPFYWTVVGLMIITGGALTVVYSESGIHLKPLLCVNIGASAPLILGSIVGKDGDDRKIK